ncbi:uncharacterized protein LOC113351100 [Papaver somniferum]|uniref:uncharacterized protein LOC113351100 n=1 Tax=Papaver somniferum TaxID=3469 RepID=UPI000E6FE53B|nr:uncharacterized protein LOC113351100 [Papaver somniferum]
MVVIVNVHYRKYDRLHVRGRRDSRKPDEYLKWITQQFQGKDITDFKRLVDGPSRYAVSHNAYAVNGYIFYTADAEKGMSTQNSEVSMNATTTFRASARDQNTVNDEVPYFGIVKQILELDYTTFKQTVFYCDWVRVEDKVNGWKIWRGGSSKPEKESPTGEIYRPDVFLKTHKVTPYDNPSSYKSLAAAKLALVKEEYDKNPSAQKCLGTDAVTKIFGADRKGYIRGMGAGVSKSQFLASEFMNARLQEEKHNVLKEKQKNEALKAQLDAERQKNNTGVHDQISNSSYQQDIGMPIVPSTFGLLFLRNSRKKPVAVEYVDTTVLIDDNYNCMLHVIIEPNEMLCDRDEAVLRDVPIGNFIRWPKAYVTPVGEHLDHVTWSC